MLKCSTRYVFFFIFKERSWRIKRRKVLQNKLEWYKHQNGKYPSTTAIAQLLSNTLYYKRFFPYYTFNVLGGIDDNGYFFCRLGLEKISKIL